jgi:hypothetical protein
VHRGFRHSFSPARAAESSLLATKGYKALVLAIIALDADEAVSQYSAFQESFEFLDNMLWQHFPLLITQSLKAT